jgi:hypothetical protein
VPGRRLAVTSALIASAVIGCGLLLRIPVDEPDVDRRSESAASDVTDPTPNVPSSRNSTAAPDGRAIVALIDELLAMRSGTSRAVAYQVHTELADNVAALEPEAALALLRQLSATNTKAAVILALRVLDSVRHDARLLAAWFDSIPPIDDPVTIASIDFMQLRGTDLMRAASPKTVFEQGFSALAELDPDSALDLVLSTRDRRWDITGRAIRVWARHDPPGTLARLKPVLDDREFSRVQEDLLDKWSLAGTTEAMSYALALDDYGGTIPEARASSFWKLAVYALNSGADPEQVIAVAHRLPPEIASESLLVGYSRLAATDPDVAALRLDEVPESIRDRIIVDIAQVLAASDPVAALDWARARGVPEAEEWVINEFADADPMGALELALAVSPEAMAGALEKAVSEAVSQDPASAPRVADRLASMPLGAEQYEAAVTELVREWAREEAEPAFEWLVAQGSVLPAGVYEAAARQEADAELIASVLVRLPPAARGPWVDGFISRSLNGSDSSETSAVLAAIQGQQEFGRAMAGLLEILVRGQRREQQEWVREQQRAEIEAWILAMPDSGIRQAVMAEYREALAALAR